MKTIKQDGIDWEFEELLYPESENNAIVYGWDEKGNEYEGSAIVDRFTGDVIPEIIEIIEYEKINQTK